jgi:hypothetical protein
MAGRLTRKPETRERHDRFAIAKRKKEFAGPGNDLEPLVG